MRSQGESTEQEFNKVVVGPGHGCGACAIRIGGVRFRHET
jgi:hypothetical protein